MQWHVPCGPDTDSATWKRGTQYGAALAFSLHRMGICWKNHPQVQRRTECRVQARMGEITATSEIVVIGMFVMMMFLITLLMGVSGARLLVTVIMICITSVVMVVSCLGQGEHP